MKKAITILQILIGIFCVSITQAQWTTVGFTTSNANLSSIAVNPTNGELYMAYTESNNGNKITVRKYDGSSWVAVGNTAFTSGTADQICLVISDNGIPFVAYRDGNSKVTVMRYVSGSWGLVGAASFSSPNVSRLSLAVHDATNHVYVTYTADGPPPFTSNAVVYVQYFNTINWTYYNSTMGISGAVDLGITPTIALDTNHAPYIAYINGSTCYVKKPNTTGGWVDAYPGAATSTTAQYPYITFDRPTNTPYVVYKNAANAYRAALIKLTASGWTQVGTAGFSTGFVEYIKVTVKNGVPYVVYSDNGTSGSNGDKTTVMTYNGSNWTSVGPIAFSSGQSFYQTITYSGNKLYVGHILAGAPFTAEVVEYNLGTAINQIPNQFTDFSIAPNPVNDVLTVRTNEQIDVLTIMSIDGKVIKSVTTPNISVADLAQGVYLLQVTTPKGVGIERFVKQ